MPPIKGRHLGELAVLRAKLDERRRAEAARAIATAESEARRIATNTAANAAANKAASSAAHHAQSAASSAATKARGTRPDSDSGIFADAIGHVVPLRKTASERPARARPTPIARQRERDEAAALAESIGDVVDAESLLETDDALSFRRRGIGVDVVRKLRRGVWALQDEIDLHGLRRDEAHARVAQFLREATRSGLRCVRVVHGKGHGSPGREPVLKARVKAWLVKHEDVLAFTHARPADGGHGALIVLLKASEKNGALR
jgi:DNA-nicking Smr family endonuclease